MGDVEAIGQARMRGASPAASSQTSASPTSASPSQSARATGTQPGAPAAQGSSRAGIITFDRRELDRILDLYGRMVAAGEWRDYALDFLKDKAVFSVFRRAMDVPLYRIEKEPRLARRQGAYSVVSQTGLILKRGQELPRVLAVLEKPLRAIG